MPIDFLSALLNEDSNLNILLPVEVSRLIGWNNWPPLEAINKSLNSNYSVDVL